MMTIHLNLKLVQRANTKHVFLCQPHRLFRKMMQHGIGNGGKKTHQNDSVCVSQQAFLPSQVRQRFSFSRQTLHCNLPPRRTCPPADCGVLLLLTWRSCSSVTRVQCDTLISNTHKLTLALHGATHTQTIYRHPRLQARAKRFRLHHKKRSDQNELKRVF